MSADVARIIAQYDGQTDLRSGSRHILNRAKDYPGVTPEQQFQLDQILRDAREAKAAKADGTAEPARDVHAEQMQRLADQEASIERRELTADLNVALTAVGAAGQDLQDARLLLEGALGDSRDPKEIRDAVDSLRARRPTLFGTAPAPAGKTQRRARGALPSGRAGSQKPPRVRAGSKGLAYAKKRGWGVDE